MPDDGGSPPPSRDRGGGGGGFIRVSCLVMLRCPVSGVGPVARLAAGLLCGVALAGLLAWLRHPARGSADAQPLAVIVIRCEGLGQSLLAWPWLLRLPGLSSPVTIASLKYSLWQASHSCLTTMIQDSPTPLCSLTAASKAGECTEEPPLISTLKTGCKSMPNVLDFIGPAKRASHLLPAVLSKHWHDTLVTLMSRCNATYWGGCAFLSPSAKSGATVHPPYVEVL